MLLKTLRFILGKVVGKLSDEEKQELLGVVTELVKAGAEGAASGVKGK